MSVDDPRSAAAQRTAAAPRNRSTRRTVARLATWILIVPLLAAFSFSVVAGATTLGKPDIAKAVKQLPSTAHVVEVQASHTNGAEPGKTAGEAGIAQRFAHADHLVCSVTGSQLIRIKQRYTTGRLALTVDGRSLDVVSVFGATDKDVRSYLGDSGVTCVLVQVSHVFFLPFDAHGS
jgi:hypothetical protein